MHGLFVPEQRERQRNSQELVFGPISAVQAATLLQQKRSIYAADPAGFAARPSAQE
jgi:hypothetical protein